ncbi:MAG TPA: hypothetical protein VHD37_00985 [Candidatus Paceibacterota bacterium]|nr:hypothetical protein [Candidatus Paceibacterota bacterium]
MRWLLRPKKGKPVREWYQKCTDCAGTGVKPADKHLRIFERNKTGPPERT